MEPRGRMASPVRRRSTRLGPGTGRWLLIPAGGENLRVHRRFFKDTEVADTQAASA
jgi:hypothetical protein